MLRVQIILAHIRMVYHKIAVGMAHHDFLVQANQHNVQCKQILREITAIQLPLITLVVGRHIIICLLIYRCICGKERHSRLSEKWHSIAILVLYHLLEAIHIQLKVMPEGAAVGHFDLTPAVLLPIRVIHNPLANIRIR